MIRPVRLLLFLLAAAEVTSLVWLAKATGFMGTLAILILSGLIGASLIRRSGAGLMKIMSGGRPTPEQLSSGTAGSLLTGLAGLLFIMPGLASDAVAILLLLPFTRMQVAKLFQFDTIIIRSETVRRHDPADGDVIEGEAVEIIEPGKRLG